MGRRKAEAKRAHLKTLAQEEKFQLINRTTRNRDAPMAPRKAAKETKGAVRAMVPLLLNVAVILLTNCSSAKNSAAKPSQTDSRANTPGYLFLLTVYKDE